MSNCTTHHICDCKAEELELLQVKDRDAEFIISCEMEKNKKLRQNLEELNKENEKLKKRLSAYQHNHITRDIKDKGDCPACDQYHLRQDLEAAKELIVKLKKRCELGQTISALIVEIEQWERK